MYRPFQTVTDLRRGEQILRGRRYGVIVMSAGRLAAVHVRPYPKLSGITEWFLLPHRYHTGGPSDVCWLYYNQPRRFPNFLALRYVVSSAGTRLATFRGALDVLDAIARIKQTDALLCDAANTRISDRLLARWGWQPHKPQRWHRNYIKRFYGHYPPAACAETSPGERGPSGP